jgi:hypothetical protein
MITLSGQTSFERFNVYRDDTNPLQFYYMPDGPRIAVDDKGKPLFSLIAYRRDLSQVPEADRATKLGGGILAISTELSATPDEIKRMRFELAGDPVVQVAYQGQHSFTNGRWWTLRKYSPPPVDRTKVAEALVMGLVPISSGNVSISIAGEDGTGTDNEFVKGKLVGAGSVSMTGNERASFLAKLTMDGATLLYKAMQNKDLKVINVRYDLNFNYRLTGLIVDAWCDAHKAYNALQSQNGGTNEEGEFHDNGGWHTYGHSKNTTLTDVIGESLSSGEFSGVKVTVNADSDVIKPEYVQQLEQSANDQIKQFIADTFTEYKPTPAKFDDKDPDISTELPKVGDKKYGGDYVKYYGLKKWNESMSANFHYHMEEQMVLPSKLAPNDNMSDLLMGNDVADYVKEIPLDNEFYKFLDVGIVCTADFDNDPISTVKAHLSYAAQGPFGPINEVDDFLFQKGGAPLQRFSTYIGGPDKKSYDYEYTVTYRGQMPPPPYTIKGKTDETILILNADQLGILKVDVQAGIVDWDTIKSIALKISYGSNHQTEYTLNSQKQSAKWVETIGVPVTDPYTWSAVFVDTSGQRIETKPTQQRGPLVIDQPLGQQLDITVVGIGSFVPTGNVQQISVAVRYTDKPNHYNKNASFVMAKENDVNHWKFSLVNENLRSYEYQTNVIYAGGVSRSDDWRPSDAQILLAGDPFNAKVTVLPNLLRGTKWTLGTLKLRYDDAAADIHQSDELAFTADAFGAPQYWRIRLGAPTRNTYRWQLTLFTDDNQSYEFPEASTSDQILVLRPPPKTT